MNIIKTDIEGVLIIEPRLFRDARGNFGKHFTKYGHFTQQGMAKKYFLKIWRNMHFVRYYPAEALSEPIFRTWHFFWRLRHK